MKALSIMQPWAWLIVSGQKDIENRSWSTTFRGRILVHAGKRMDVEGEMWLRNNMPWVFDKTMIFARGGIVGEVEITGCVQESTSQWFNGPFGFQLADGKPLPFRPLRGKLGFFEVEPWDAAKK